MYNFVFLYVLLQLDFTLIEHCLREDDSLAKRTSSAFDKGNSLHIVCRLIYYPKTRNFNTEEEFEETRLQILKLLINAGANIQAIDAYGYTPLHHACQAGNLGIIETLLAYGANLNLNPCSSVDPPIEILKRNMPTLGISTHLFSFDPLLGSFNGNCYGLTCADAESVFKAQVAANISQHIGSETIDASNQKYYRKLTAMHLFPPPYPLSTAKTARKILLHQRNRSVYQQNFVQTHEKHYKEKCRNSGCKKPFYSIIEYYAATYHMEKAFIEDVKQHFIRLNEKAIYVYIFLKFQVGSRWHVVGLRQVREKCYQLFDQNLPHLLADNTDFYVQRSCIEEISQLLSSMYFANIQNFNLNARFYTWHDDIPAVQLSATMIGQSV